MKRISHHHKSLRLSEIRIAALTLLVSFFFLPAGLYSYAAALANSEQGIIEAYELFFNGESVAIVATWDEEEAEALLLEARRTLAAASKELVFLEVELSHQDVQLAKGDGRLVLDDETQILASMVEALGNQAYGSSSSANTRAYTVKINDFIVNLASEEEVVTLLQAAIDKYDTERRFEVKLELDTARELSVLTAVVERRDAKAREAEPPATSLEGGVDLMLTNLFNSVEPAVEKDFLDYDNGMIHIDFENTVEVVESYLAPDELHDLAWAIEEITKEEEVNQLYEVVAGDTLSAIALNNNIPIEKLVELNDSLEDENSIIKIGEELIITVPEADMAIVWQEERFIEEYYNEDIIYIPNDDWYTNQTRTLQEPSAGIRKIAALTTYRNNKAIERLIMMEEIVYQGVPKIVERGTKIPPTYIKPLYGGRLTSGFGPRPRPTAGASTYHRGVDWATPTGTAIYASSGGVVSRAGWGSGYGYVVYIDHPDGRQTRYGHLSKILVRVGQVVSQREKIALSGNTGVSTGPHLHFDLLINGQHVNPLRYING